MQTMRNDESARCRDREQELLVARCQLGETAAFDALVERWHEPLWRYVHGMTGDPVRSEEILQEGWLRILRGIGKLRDPQRLGAWMFSIVRRTFVDGLRARYAAPRYEPLDAEPPADDAAPQLDWQESESLHRALQQLPPADRETLVLFYLRELDLRQVADVQDIPVGTVKSRLHRGRRALRRELETQGVTR